jgi:hypothetical protein
MDEGACSAVKNIGKPCAGKPHARFDEGRLMDGQSGGHVVAACGEASIKVPVAELKSASYSTPNSPRIREIGKGFEF